MSYPQSSPPPPPPPYPATVPGRRVFTNGPIGIGRVTREEYSKIDGLQDVKVDIEEAYQMGLDELNTKYLKAMDDGFVSETSMLELLALKRINDRAMSELRCGHGLIPVQDMPPLPDFPLDVVFGPESVTYTGEGDSKRWDDNVGQYPVEIKTETYLDLSHPGWGKIFDQFFRAINDEMNIRGDFVGRAGEM